MNKTKQPRVFVTQIPLRRKGEQLLPSCNINPAAEHGDIIVMFDGQSNYFGTSDTSSKIIDHFKDFDPDVDFFLPLGDPVLCTIAAGLLGQRHNNINVLKWDKNLVRYTKNRIVL